MEKMRMESIDMTAQNIDKIAALFPKLHYRDRRRKR